MMMWSTVLLLSSAIGIVAFVPMPTTRRYTTWLHGEIEDYDADSSRNNTKRGDGEGNGRASFDVELSRQRLENLISNQKDESGADTSNGKGDSNDDKVTKMTQSLLFSKILSDYGGGADSSLSLSSFPPPPPLSSIERERRLGEIKLLECLTEGDDVVPKLWDHWYSERGSTAKSRLEDIGVMLTNPRDWKECEQNLIDLVDEYGIYFVEPVNLLATLYFLQGKLDLSYKLCEIILALKPYHVGALSGIVQVSIGLNDPIASLKWAQESLPRALSGPALGKDGVQQTENPQRVQWVEKAVAKAKELLDKAELRTKEDFFGKPETYYDIGSDYDTGDIDGISGFNFSDDNIDESAWQ